MASSTEVTFMEAAVQGGWTQHIGSHDNTSHLHTSDFYRMSAGKGSWVHSIYDNITQFYNNSWSSTTTTDAMLTEEDALVSDYQKMSQDAICTPELSISTAFRNWNPCMKELPDGTVVGFYETPFCCHVCGGCFYNGTCWQCPDFIQGGDFNSGSKEGYFTEDIIAHNVWSYMSPTILIMGTVGNVISAVVMSRKSLRRSVTALCLTALAIVDTLVLYTGLVRYWVTAITGSDIRNQSALACKLHSFFVYWFTDYAVWIIVIVTLERYLSVQFPHKARVYCTKAAAVCALATVGLVLGGFNLHFLWTNQLISTGPPGQERIFCHVTRSQTRFRRHIWPWIDFSLFSICPFAVLLLLNAGILLVLASAHYRRQEINVVGGQLPRMTTMTAMLLTVSFTLFLTTAPISIFLVRSITRPESRDPQAEAARRMWWAICNELAYVNNAINFLLYCVSGARFRRELKGMLRCRHQVHPEPVQATHSSQLHRANVPNDVAMEPQPNGQGAAVTSSCGPSQEDTGL